MAEERMTDDPLKKGLEDEFIDIELEGLPEEAEENYDEDLVGLTPTKLKEELDRRREQEEKARREKEKLLKTAAEKRAVGNFEEAASFYEQASLYDDDDFSVDVWACRTEEYASIECFEREEISAEFRNTLPAARTAVLKKLRGDIEERLATYKAEATPLREEVEAGMDSRRDAFRANRNYYLTRFLIALGALILTGIATAIAGSYIVRRQDLIAPILTAVFGVLALVSLGVTFFFSRGLFLGQKLVSDNEKLSSTERGSRLYTLERAIKALETALAEPDVEEDPFENE